VVCQTIVYGTPPYEGEGKIWAKISARGRQSPGHIIVQEGEKSPRSMGGQFPLE